MSGTALYNIVKRPLRCGLRHLNTAPCGRGCPQHITSHHGKVQSTSQHAAEYRHSRQSSQRLAQAPGGAALLRHSRAQFPRSVAGCSHNCCATGPYVQCLLGLLERLRNPTVSQTKPRFATLQTAAHASVHAPPLSSSAVHQVHLSVICHPCGRPATLPGLCAQGRRAERTCHAADHVKVAPQPLGLGQATPSSSLDEEPPPPPISQAQQPGARLTRPAQEATAAAQHSSSTLRPCPTLTHRAPACVYPPGHPWQAASLSCVQPPDEPP